MNFSIITMEAVCIVFLLMMLALSLYSAGKERRVRFSAFNGLLVSVLAALTIDMTSYIFDGNASISVPLFILNYLSYAMDPIIMVFYIRYIVKSVEEVRPVKVNHFNIVGIYCAINFFMVFWGSLNGDVFTLNQGCFVPGARIYVVQFCNLIPFLYAFLITLGYRKVLGSKETTALLVFSVFPWVGILLEVIYPEASFSYSLSALSLMIVFFGVQVREIRNYHALDDERVAKEKEQDDLFRKNMEVLLEEAEPEVTINALLLNLRNYYGAEYACIIEANREHSEAYLSYESCGENRSPLKEKYHTFPIEAIDHWVEALRPNLSLSFQSVEELNPDSIEYANYKRFGIVNLALAPITVNGKIVGILGIYNATAHMSDAVVLRTISALITSEILRKNHSSEEQETLRVLAKSVLFVCYADLLEDYIRCYHVDPSSIYAEALLAGGPFSDLAAGYFAGALSEEEAIKYKHYADPKFVIERLKRSEQFALEIVDRSGDFDRSCSLEFIRIDESGNTAVIVAKDLTEVLRREREVSESLRKAKEEADKANLAKTNFLFNMSHDIRTPMNAILGYTAMARKYAENPAQAESYLDKIDVAGQQLLSLVNQVLDMAGIESGNVVLTESKYNITERVEAILTILSASAAVGSIHLSSKFENLKDNSVWVDEGRLNQILLNIIGNGIKYTPEGGEVGITVSQHLSGIPGMAQYKFVISDNGIGMSEEYLSHIFESFSRAQNTTQSRVEGTGLGMSIVKRLVDLMDGEIEVTSKEGEGTTVCITLELKIARDTNESKEEPQPKGSDRLIGRRILLVDDNEMNREIAKDILCDFGLLVEEADDGDVAVDMVASGKPGYYDIVLMDVQMPRMDGYAATRAIRALSDPDLADLPILAMTANAFSADVKAAEDAGMNGHLPKPLDIRKMITALNRFIR